MTADPDGYLLAQFEARLPDLGDRGNHARLMFELIEDTPGQLSFAAADWPTPGVCDDLDEAELRAANERRRGWRA